MCVVSRGVKSQELDTPAIEKRFAYTFLQQLITYVDQAHQHMMEFGKTLFKELSSNSLEINLMQCGCHALSVRELWARVVRLVQRGRCCITKITATCRVGGYDSVDSLWHKLNCIHTNSLQMSDECHHVKLFTPYCFWLCSTCYLDVGTRPKGEKIPHEQQIKFFGKVRTHHFIWSIDQLGILICLLLNFFAS